MAVLIAAGVSNLSGSIALRGKHGSVVEVRADTRLDLDRGGGLSQIRTTLYLPMEPGAQT